MLKLSDYKPYTKIDAVNFGVDATSQGIDCSGVEEIPKLFAKTAMTAWDELGRHYPVVTFHLDKATDQVRGTFRIAFAELESEYTEACHDTEE